MAEAAVSSGVEGKRVLVTGATRGLGLAIANRLARDGARVIAGSRGAASDRDLADRAVIPLDVSDESSIRRAFEWIDRRHGGLDVLVNNAGVAVFKAVGDLEAADFAATMSTNVTGAFLCAKEAFRRMAAARGGRLVHIGSIAAVTPMSGTAAYAASKAALEALSASLNHEGAAVAVRSTLLRLGACNTDLMSGAAGLSPSDMLDPEEVAGVVSFIAAQSLDKRLDSMVLLPPKGIL